jgi:hypothetical protein
VYSWDASHYKLQTPTIYNWNVTIERQLGANWLVRGAYVASRSNHLMENEQLNPSAYIPGSTLSPDARRPFQPYTSIVQASAAGNAWYNSMQLSLEKRLSRGFTILANYTWAKSTDNIPAGKDLGIPQGGPQITLPLYVKNFKTLDTGPFEFDYRHVFVLSYVWDLPALSNQNRLLRAVAGGWQWSGITSAQSGAPLTLTAGLDRSQSAIGNDKAQFVGPAAYGSGACGSAAPCVDFLVPGAFALPALGTFGNMAKGTLRGPGLFNWDMGVFKRFPIHERWSVQFRAEFFNAFNRVNLNSPVITVSAGGFGSIRSARDPRIGQLALKILF